MPKPALTRFSTLQVYNPDMQGITDLAPSDLPEFIVPQVTTDQADVLPNLQNGMVVYDIIEGVFKFRQQEDWISFGTGDGDVVGPEASEINNIAVFANENGTLIEDSGVSIDRVPEMLRRNTQAVGDPPVINQIGNLGHLQFVGGLGVILVDDLIPVEFITRGTGVDSQVCTVFSGDLPMESSSPSALVEINSTSGVLLLSRMTTDQRLALQDPVGGMMVYDTTLNQFLFYENNQWQIPSNITSPSSTTKSGIATWGNTTGTSLNSTDVTLSSSMMIGLLTLYPARYPSAPVGKQTLLIATDNFDNVPTTPDAILEVKSTQGGILFPRMNTTQMNALSTPVEGLTLYNTDTASVMLYHHNAWTTMGTNLTTPATTTQNGLALWGDSAGGSLVSPPISLTTRFTSDIYYLQGLYGILGSQFVFSNGGNSVWLRVNAMDGQAWPSLLLEATTDQAQMVFVNNAGFSTILQCSNTMNVNYTLTFPLNAGSAGQALITDGNGNLSWGNALSTDQNGNATVQGYMQINGYLGYQLIGPQSYGYLNSTTPTGTGNHFSANVSLVCTNRIVASEFDAVSSAEIKNIVTSGEDIDHEVLELFRHIPFFKYTYKDTIKEGSMPHYGVVAEELSPLLPHLVIHHQNFVPNIYRNAQVASEEQGHFTLTLEHPLTVIPQDERLLLLGEDGEKEVTLLDVSENILCVRYDGSLPEKVFVYGTYKDCPSVSKQKIFEMGMIVLQNVLRRLEHIEQRIMH